MSVTLIDTYVTSGIIKSAPVLPTSGDNFREKKKEENWSERFLLEVYRRILLLLDHIPYRRAHFVNDALELCSLLSNYTMQ